MSAEQKEAYAWIRRPWFGTLLTLAIILAGMVGSIYSDDIKRAFPFYWGQGAWSWHASLFWALALCAAAGFFFREAAIDRDQQQLQRETLSRAESFERLLRTLPPEDFLSIFSALYQSAEMVMKLSRSASEKSVEDIRLFIRRVLRIVATLAAKFDGDSSGVIYGANLMLYRRSEEIPEEERENIRARLKFCDETVGLGNLRGILDLDTSLSATNEASDAVPPDLLEPMALPIPHTAETEEGRYRVLPGAPLAVVQREPNLYPDTTKLAAEWAVSGDLTHEVREKLGKFFRESRVKGFASIPLYAQTPDGADRKDTDPIGVLNIHCTHAGLLSHGEVLLHLFDILYPFRRMLVELLLLLAEHSTRPANQVAKPTS